VKGFSGEDIEFVAKSAVEATQAKNAATAIH
jgi:hypothetical protein